MTDSEEARAEMIGYQLSNPTVLYKVTVDKNQTRRNIPLDEMRGMYVSMIKVKKARPLPPCPF
jgi:hypothetical protein